MFSTVTTWFTLLIVLAVLLDVAGSQLIAQVRNGQFYSRFKCSANQSEAVCASDNPTKSYNSSSREQCCLTCNNLHWNWFNFINKTDQTQSAGGECQLFSQNPTKVEDKTGCTLYKSDSKLLNQTEIASMCAPPPSLVIIMDRPSTTSSWNQSWSAYKNGFSLADSGYWRGLEQVHQLTSSASYRLRVEFLPSSTLVWTTVEHQSFVIGDEVNTQYKMNFTGYSGNVTDRLSNHNGMMFSTSERDNDIYSGWCGQMYGGTGWWFRACWDCCLTCSSPSWGGAVTASRMSIVLN